ncbi:MAG: hypothetical protein OEZ15_09500 [Gammaproteobacteria bacterium]|nr:hypothetical protein [Gammaproteobacteria bacterium]
MFRQLITCFTCISMIGLHMVPRFAYATEHPAVTEFDQVSLQEKYPKARIIRVLPEEYATLEKNLRQRGYRQSEILPLQLAQNDIEGHAGVITAQQQEVGLSDDCVEPDRESAGEESLQVMLDFTEDMMQSSNSSSGDDAAVLFVIVGTVVVVVWSLYVFKYLYDVSIGNAPCGHWREFSAVSSSASSGTGQHARFDGLRYSTGFRQGVLDVGIGFELGQADILLSEIAVLELHGRYWLLGPILRWRLSESKNPSYFQMSFVAGSTEHDEVGMLAKANLGVLFGIGDSLQLGLNWGAMNINLNEDQGIITERSQYHYLYGINVGFRF